MDTCFDPEGLFSKGRWEWPRPTTCDSGRKGEITSPLPPLRAVTSTVMGGIRRMTGSGGTQAPPPRSRSVTITLLLDGGIAAGTRARARPAAPEK